MDASTFYKGSALEGLAGGYTGRRALPRGRSKTLTALVGAAPLVQAQAAEVQRLQFFLSEAAWDAEAINARRLALLKGEPTTVLLAGGVLVIDDTGDRKKGSATDHVARQYLGSVVKVGSEMQWNGKRS